MKSSSGSVLIKRDTLCSFNFLPVLSSIRFLICFRSRLDMFIKHTHTECESFVGFSNVYIYSCKYLSIYNEIFVEIR